MIELYHVTKTYPGNERSALKEVTLKIEKGEFVFITGASGAGKTTLLKLVFGAEKVTDGQILVNGHNLSRFSRDQVSRLRRTIGVVFQDFKLLKNRTALENVQFAMEVLGSPQRDSRRKAWLALKHVQLHDKIDSYPLNLSGGEQQRIAIARALVNNPVLLLADEPTGSLDPEITREIMKMFEDINTRGTTVVVASHNRDLIGQMGKRVIHLDQGTLAAEGR